MTTTKTPSPTPNPTSQQSEALDYIKELALAYGSLYENYSGRGMYGAHCVGIVTSELAQLQQSARRSGVVGLKDFCTDNMGRDFIVYWPGIQMYGNTEPEQQPKQDPDPEPTDIQKAERYLTSYLRGFGSGNTPRLRALAHRGQWSQHAGAVLDQRAYKLLEGLDSFVLQEIEAGNVSIPAIATRVADALDAEGQGGL